MRTITLDENNLTDFESEIILSDDLLDYDVSNFYIANHGYSEYKSVFLPAVFGTIGLVAVICVVVAAVIIIAKKKKGSKQKK